MSTEDTRGVLLLSHVGFSFLEDLAGTVAARGLKCHVLSSLPEPQHQESRPAVLADLADNVRMTEGHVLTPRDVEDYLDHLQAAGEDVRCCLTVWEGYRHLMALANARLGVPDLDEKQILQLRDKVTVRNRLYDAGLSRSRASVLTTQTFAERQRGGGRHFVKPVSGIASFGTFPLTADTTWADLVRIAAEARSDTVYASVFTPQHGPDDSVAPPTTARGTDPGRDTPAVEFLIEDYVPGPEFSFEVIAVGGEPHVVAVHEKCELTEAAGAVLEDACVSPPTSLPRKDLAAGLRWVSSVMDVLDLTWGCFHVEARHAPTGWDLIEVNPRVGGSLISPSVGALTGGPDLLDLWLESLLTAHRPSEFVEDLKSLSFTPDGTPQGSNATFFRVFFASSGTIREIRLNDSLVLRPILSHVLLEPGDVVEQASREVFLGQVLWSMDRADRDVILPELVPASERALEIVYERER